MGLLQSIHQGTCGVRFALPNGVEVVSDGELSATVHDRERGVALGMQRFEERLDLRHPELLRKDIERHARDLFETCFRLGPPQPGAGDPMTHDPSWSPVIDVTPVRAGGVDALTVIHRLWDQPGRDEIMGHLLIPLARGLFEIRVVPKQADPQLPDQPLIATRRTLEWLLQSAGIAVVEPQRDLPEGEVAVVSAGIAVTPPPRYLLMEAGGPDPSAARWSRVSFSGTDGVQLLTVAKLARPLTPVDPRMLRARADVLVRGGVPEGATEVHMKTSARPENDGRLHAESYRAYAEKGFRKHAVIRWIAESDGRGAMVALETSQCVPVEELQADAVAVADSLRFLDQPAIRIAPPQPPRRSLRRRG